MPYDYRKLSPKERQEIVRHRQELGYPLHAPPHPFREAGYYLITAANYEHAAIMNSPQRLTAFENLLFGVLKNIQVELIAWVILPNHYHFLIDTDSLDSLSIPLKHLHGSTSYQWNIEDHLTSQRRVWYKYSDRMIRSEQQLQHTFNYIHYNPLKHGLTEDLYAWPWSSIGLYMEQKGRGWLEERWKSSPIPKDYGGGWDD